MSELVWGEPPPSRARGLNGHWRNVAEQLRVRPGEWARVATKDTANRAGSIAGNLRSRHGLESVSRTRNVNEHDVWARWPEENGT